MKYSLHVTIDENDEDLNSNEIVAIKNFNDSNEMFNSFSKYLPLEKKSLLTKMKSTFNKTGFIMFDWRKQNTKTHYYFVFVTN